MKQSAQFFESSAVDSNTVKKDKSPPAKYSLTWSAEILQVLIKLTTFLFSMFSVKLLSRDLDSGRQLRLLR